MHFSSGVLIRGGFIAAGLLLSSFAAHADIIDVATGLDATNTVLASGGLSDAHWMVNSASAQSVYPNNADWYGGWLANGPASDWIAIDANVTNNGPAPYTFSRTFDLTGYDVSTASLTGAWTIDDGGNVSLNGNVLDSQGSGGWGSLHGISAASPLFLPGLNTLSITLTDSDDYLEGVRLEGSVNVSPASAVPEPGSVALLVGLGVTGAGFLARRRKQA